MGTAFAVPAFCHHAAISFPHLVPFDGKGVTTNTEYDSQGRITENFVANTAEVNYTYNKGSLSRITRSDGQVYNFAQNHWGQTTGVSVGQTLLASYTYNANNGLQQTQTYGNGDTVEYTYDILGRIAQTVYKDEGGTPGRTLTYTYTGDGQLWSILDSSTGRTAYFAYDTLGRLIRSVEGGMQTYNQYDSFSRLVSRSFWDNTLGSGTETYTYDTDSANALSDGILTGMQMANGNTIALEYDSLQRLKYRHTNSGKQDPGGMWERFDYTGSRVTAKLNWIDDSTQSHWFQYEYDGNGNILRENAVHSGHITTYTYDDLNQLTEVKVYANSGNTLDRTESYSYDNAGNLQTFNNGSGISHSYDYTYSHSNEQGQPITADGQVIAHPHSDWKDLLKMVDEKEIIYDQIGNPTSYYDGTAMTWAEGRRLESVTIGGETTSYRYNADGLRIQKTNPDSSYIIYHIADGRYVGETWFYPNMVPYRYLRYTYNDAGSVCGFSLWNAGSTAWTEYYFSTNLQGDVLQVYEASNNALAASYTYDAWGNILSANDHTEDDLVNINPFRYRGYHYDSETGFYYLQSRYYDPEIGRFLNADAYTTTGQGFAGNNMFAYCLNNPVICTDHSGTDAVILLDKEFVGHLGIMAQDEEGTWWHFYWGVTSNSYSWTILGINLPVTTWCVEYTGKLTLKAINEAGQFSGDYEKMMYIKGDFTDSISEMKNPTGKYNLYTNNCSQKSMEILALSNSEYTSIFSKAADIVLPKDAYNYVDKWVSVKKTLNKGIRLIPKKPVSFPILGGAYAHFI